MRGHAGRLRRILQDPNASKMAALHHLAGIEQAAAVLARDPTEEALADPEGVTRGGRDPSLFQENGRYLNDRGRALLFSLFDSGYSVRSAAARIGISANSAASHRAAWLRRPASSDSAENL